MSNKTIYEERADDLRILAGKEPPKGNPLMSKTPEQEARNILEHMEIKGAQNFSAGELAEIANIIAENARLREDAERYHFLRDDFSVSSPDIDGNHAWAYRNFSLRGPTLDAAIDAARKETK